MKLIRIALLRSRSTLQGIQADDGDVSLSSLGKHESEDYNRLVVAAEVPLTELPECTNENRVVVPEKSRKRCEAVIETVANLIVLESEETCAVGGTIPPAALEPESGEERTWLSDWEGFHRPSTKDLGASFNLTFEAFSKTEALEDRLDGVALWAESLSHSSLSGRFHEYIRIFERAFTLASTPLVDPLTRYLSAASGYGYTEEEVEEWIKEIRHPLTHADRRDYFLVEADVRPVIRRVAQAAFDVLLNKEIWRSPEVGRRTVWRPDGIIGKDTNILKQYSTPTIRFQLLEPFGVYPMDLNAGKVGSLPEDWWDKGWTEELSDRGEAINDQ